MDIDSLVCMTTCRDNPGESDEQIFKSGSSYWWVYNIIL